MRFLQIDQWTLTIFMFLGIETFLNEMFCSSEQLTQSTTSPF